MERVKLQSEARIESAGAGCFVGSYSRRSVKPFSSLGQLKMVRLLQKFDGSHDGFGFVVFSSKKETLAAIEALLSIHLYVRYAIIAFAVRMMRCLYQ